MRNGDQRQKDAATDDEVPERVDEPTEATEDRPPDDDTGVVRGPDDESGVSRRNVLKTAGAGGALAGVAGCMHHLTKTFTANPATLEPVAGKLGFKLKNARKVKTRRKASAGGATVDLKLFSHLANYSGLSSFGAAATPQARVKGKKLNPISTASLKDVVTGKVATKFLAGTPVAGKSWQMGPVKKDSRSVKLLGKSTTMETYAGITSKGNLAVVSVARRDHKGDVVVAGGSRSWNPPRGNKQSMNTVTNDRRFQDHLTMMEKTMPHVTRKSAQKLSGQQNNTTKQASVTKALGSAAERGKQQIYFVQEGGELRRYNILQNKLGTPASGTVTIQGTWLFNFDNGVGGGGSRGKAKSGEEDVWWRIKSKGDRRLVPRNGAEVAHLEDATYGDLTAATLQNQPYTTDPIDGSTNGELKQGSVVAVKTSEGNYAKAKVTSLGYDLKLKFETYEVEPKIETLGDGYSKPEDVALAGDGKTAYVTERGSGGNLLEVSISNANRSSATVVASGLGTPHQMHLEQGENVAYVATDSKIVRVDVGSGNTTVLYSGLTNARGIVVDDSGTFAYVTENPKPKKKPKRGSITRVELRHGRRQEMASGITQPFHLLWPDERENSLLYVDGDRHSIWSLDLASETADAVYLDTPLDPASVALASENRGFVFTKNAIAPVPIATGLFNQSGPLFLGVGHIPVSDINSNGYANTGGPAYPLNVDDAPFGGTLSLLLNHRDAYKSQNARYYRVFVDGNVRQQPWRGLQWSTKKNEMVSTKVTPKGKGYFPVRDPSTIWLREHLGYKLRTGDLSDGLHTLKVEFYSNKSAGSKVSSTSTKIRIDNREPNARLGRIFHQLQNGTEEVIDACAIVDKAKNAFKFEVTAHDDEQHLRAWRLRALWGHGDSEVIHKEHYSKSQGTSWAGPVNKKIGEDRKESDGHYWDAKKKKCAHTFYLHAWGRAINGYDYIHRDGDHKSLTMLLP